jgi:hypothetical protein
MVPQDPNIVNFWEVLQSFNPEQRRQFLRFVWGRARLPPGGVETSRCLELQPLARAIGSLPSPLSQPGSPSLASSQPSSDLRGQMVANGGEASSSGADRVQTRADITSSRLLVQDTHLPIAHTCYFSLELPRYSSIEVMRQRLLYAINEGIAIDTDHTVMETTAWDTEG